MNARDLLHLRFAEALEPPERITVSEWAARHMVLPRQSNQRSGSVRLTALQSQIADTAASGQFRKVVVRASAQLGKSIVLNALMFHRAMTQGGPMLLVRPDDADIRSYRQTTFLPLIEASPTLRAAFGAGRRAVNSNAQINFPGGHLSFASAYKPSELAGKSVSAVFMDEVDRWPLLAEGWGADLAAKRTASFLRPLIYLCSTPTNETSQIQKHYELAGTKKHFFIPCPHCGEFFELDKKCFHYDTSKDPSTARLVDVDNCGAFIDEAQRMQAVQRGEFRNVSTDGPEKDSVAFAAWEAASSFSSLANIAQASRAQTLEERRSFTNLVLGEVHVSNVAAEVELSVIEQRAEPLPANSLPADTTMVAAGCDLQGDRVEVTFVAQIGRQVAIIDHCVLPGDPTSGATDGLWRDLSVLLGRSFKTLNGNVLEVSATVIDAGWQASFVHRFVATQRALGRAVFPSIGRAGWDRPEIVESGGKTGAYVRNLILGVDNLKLAATRGLMSPDPETCIRIADHLPADFYVGLGAEHLERKIVRGRPKESWVKAHNRVRSEAIDCTAYGIAALRIAQQRGLMARKKNVQNIKTAAAKLAEIGRTVANKGTFH